MGPPWPCAAIPASMPGCPLRNTCVRPLWLTGRPDQKQKQKQSKSEAAYLDGSRRRIALAVRQLIELGELLANQVLGEGVLVTEA
ncbi:DUF6124 family protein [Pseudomonas sp. SMV71]|uniref:DUF6124 family protein n=1 Tax=Pseudomonas sp. SMV71 TaxID=3390195 RepID=UPI003F82F85B